MNKIIFLLSKDCLCKEALNVYNGVKFNTPNIDELAEKGTVFNKHYATAASTSMSMSSFLTGKYPYEFENRETYEPVQPNEYESIFSILQKRGYDCHLIWDETWMDMAWKYVREFGDETKTIIHNIDIAQPVGSHKKNNAKNKLIRSNKMANETCEKVIKELNSINLNQNVFIWLHLPHVLKGCISYMDDMEYFDKIVGYVRKLVGDDNIFLTTDHGHMNMHKGIVGYGFHVYEPIACIPLITPKINGMNKIDYLTSHIDLCDIILNKNVKKKDFTIVDTTYYMQPHRKTAVINERFKYIYNKQTKKEELYDLLFDPNENYNILVESYYDKDRNSIVRYDELYYYPNKEEALKNYKYLKGIFMNINRKGSFYKEFKIKLKKGFGDIKRKIKNK